MKLGTSFIFDSLTYRASRDWGALLGYSAEGLAEMNHKCFELYRECATAVGLAAENTVISDCIGPKGDAYQTNQDLTAESAEACHREQIETFKTSGADIVTALTGDTLKNRVMLENYRLPGALEAAIGAFIDHYNHRRYHESLGNLTPADVYLGRANTIRKRREEIKPQTIEKRRLLHRQSAA